MANREFYKDQENIKFLEGKNKLFLLAYESFLYRRVNGKFPKTTWKCVNGCDATVETFKGVFVTAEPITNHTHLPPANTISVTEAKMIIKKRVETEFNLTPRQIYKQERAKLLMLGEHDAHLQLGSFESMRHNLYYYRNATFPKAPKQRQDIELNGDWTRTLNLSENFVLADDGLEDKILIFGTESSLRILCNSEYVVSDGTFSVHPDIFKQLYVFHAPYFGKVLPLVFCLLPGKTYEIYCRLLQLLKNVAIKIGTIFQPPRFHIDYEMSMIKAVNTVFPSNRVQGCFFHYTQCIWRKVQELGFSEQYKKYKHIKRWVRRFSALPFLPLDDIDDGFIEIHENAPVPITSIISIEQIEKFHDYVLNTWVHDTDAQFHRSLWNQFENEGPRTTNNAEGWHNKLNKEAKSRLSFYQFLHFLKEMQVDIDATKFDLISESPSRKLAKCMTVNNALSVAKQNYGSGNISILDYLDSVSFTIKLD